MAEPGAGPTENSLARFNLGLNGQNPNFDLTEEARTRIAAIPASEQIKTAEELIPTSDQVRELETAKDLTDPETGQNFRALKVNWPEPDDNGKISSEVTVFLPAFLSDVAEGPTHERVKQVALQTDTPLLAMNQPSQYGSDKLTDAQREALDKNGSLKPTAEAMLRAMQKEGITNINLVGTSMGAWTASSIAAIAEEFGVEVHEVILVEPANSEATTASKLRGNFQKEGKHFDLYHSHPADPDLIHAAKLDKSFIRRKLYEASLLLKPLITGRAKDTLNRYPAGMANGSLQSDLAKALEKRPEMHTTIANGGISLISGTETNNAIADSFEQDHPNQVERVVFSGETHSTLESPKAYGAFVRQTLALRRHKPVTSTDDSEPANPPT